MTAASPRILMVDDTPANLRLLRRILADRGYLVHAANSGSAALQFLQTTIPDLVLLDVKMPDLDGYEVCRRMKAERRTRDIPVIFVSAMDAAWDKVTAFSAGGVDYIVKPVEESEVLARVETHLALCGLRRSLEQRVRERTAELLQAQQALYESQQLLKAIIDSSNALIYVKDLDGTYMLANRRFLHLFGSGRTEVRACCDGDLFPPGTAEQMRASDLAVIASGTPAEGEERLPHAGTMHSYVSVRSPLRDREGRIYAVCCIATDITERVREEETLRELNEMLESRLAQRSGTD